MWIVSNFQAQHARAATKSHDMRPYSLPMIHKSANAGFGHDKSGEMEGIEWL